MRIEEEFYPNDTTVGIRRLIKLIKEWSKDNPYAEPRHTAMVLSKLEEAELLSLRMVNDDAKPDKEPE